MRTAAQRQKHTEELRQAYNLEIRRTANAGVLIEMDGLSVLIDGVSGKIAPYEETPESIKKELRENFPDIVAFTHAHGDHYGRDYAELYKKATLRSVCGPESFLFKNFGDVTLTGIPTRHIGKFEIEHTSFVLEGSRTVWFMGDSSPLEWKNKENLPIPDVVIVPFAFANTDSAWKITKSFGAEAVVIVHMPAKEEDSYGIWEAVERTVGNGENVFIPKMGETIEL